MIADKVSSAAPDLTNEKEELAQIKTKISNGVKVILGGLNLPELKEDLARLRIRKSELEDIFQRRIAERPKSLLLPLSSFCRMQWTTGIRKTSRRF